MPFQSTWLNFKSPVILAMSLAISHTIMKIISALGLYFTALIISLSIWSVHQVEHGLGHADFSFVLFLPIALGLIFDQRWAIYGSVLLGFASSVLALTAAVIHGTSHINGLELNLGTFQISSSNEAGIWALALIYLSFIGAPMMSTLIIPRAAKI